MYLFSSSPSRIIGMSLSSYLLLTIIVLSPRQMEQKWTDYVVEWSQRLIDRLEHCNLTARVARAICSGATPDRIEHIVGRPATINTIHDGKLPLELANFEIDGLQHPRGDDIWLRDSATIVYWAEALRGRSATIVGVRWLMNGHMRLFTGRVYLP
jgi:hypothetical protein